MVEKSIKIVLILVILILFWSVVDSCICGDYILKVCGQNGKTYNNICELRCAKTTKKHDGPCC
ncbi:thrombin inhibitor rhodniin-like [Anticarsia gemmatalis]|uniref:thrombin inhibitor rhodniin-like n=1 Tax=Anticarsia gemmatalis TaxID=129554 RepID=UPI003F758954